MLWRRLALGAAGTATILGAGLTMSQPAAARAHCEFAAFDARGKVIARGHGSAVKMSWACNRARRQCNRALKVRPFRGCHRIGQAAR